jgi:hypothetical protein
VKGHGHRRAEADQSGGQPSLAFLIERSAQLKRDLVGFAYSPRFERSLTSAMLEAAGPEAELDEAEAIGVVDRFALQHRLPDGKTVVDRFIASRPDLTVAEREILLGVDAVFRKILRKPHFTWAEHGEALLRRRKAWYYEREPRPGVSVIGDRLVELALGGRR